MRFDADVGLELGTNSPSTYGLRFVGTRSTIPTDVPTLTPRQSAQVDGTWTPALHPGALDHRRGGYFYYDADNNIDTTLRVGRGRCRPRLPAGREPAGARRRRLRRPEQEETIGGERQTTDDNSGATLRGDFFYIQDNFNFVGDGRLTTAAPQTRFSFSVRGNYALARGSLTGRVFNRYTTDDDGDTEVRVTGVGIGLVRDLNTVSRLRPRLRRRQPDKPGRRRTIRHHQHRDDPHLQLRPDPGSDHRRRLPLPQRDRGSRPDAESNMVFLTIGRAFETGL